MTSLQNYAYINAILLGCKVWVYYSEDNFWNLILSPLWRKKEKVTTSGEILDSSKSKMSFGEFFVLQKYSVSSYLCKVWGNCWALPADKYKFLNENSDLKLITRQVTFENSVFFCQCLMLQLLKQTKTPAKMYFKISGIFKHWVKI